jgi:pseudaminic acid cytidylyltransferase
MRIAIIPARGGSKRIPRKNIKLFSGKPMISFAIEAAFNSNLFDEVIVSTDDNETSELAKKYNATTPFIRPANLSDDYTPTVPVVSHAIHELEKSGKIVTAACCIYPCVPLLNEVDIRDSWQLLQKASSFYSFPIAEFPSAIQRALKRNLNGVIEPFSPDYTQIRTQDLEPAYYDAGLFYWGWRDSWIKQHEIHPNGVGLVIPNWRAVDIDNSDDWTRAELMFQTLKNA